MKEVYMIIDAHQHFWQYNAQRDTWIDANMQVLRRDFLPDDLSPILRQNNVNACIAVQADQSETETEFLLALAADNPFIKGVVGWLDLSSPDIEDSIIRFSNREKLVGLRHIVQGEKDPNFMQNEAFNYGISLLSKYDLSYDLLVLPHQLQSAYALCAQYPNQAFIIDHLAKPYIKDKKIAPWSEDIRRIASLGNVYCKVSGMVTEADWHNWKNDDFWSYLDVVFESFGQDRLVFGSDWPVCLLAADYSQVIDILKSYCSRHDYNQDAIFGQNAINFYKIKVA